MNWELFFSDSEVWGCIFGAVLGGLLFGACLLGVRVIEHLEDKEERR